MKPSHKTPEMDQALDKLSLAMFGRTRSGSIESNICIDCGEQATEFRDELSAKEFSISGLCQKCQDKVFGR